MLLSTWIDSRRLKIHFKALPHPKNQVAEGLHLLIEQALDRKGVTRVQAMLRLYVMNFPELVRKLRDRGVNIETKMHVKVNRFGREVRYGEYFLVGRKDNIKWAFDVYKKINR